MASNITVRSAKLEDLDFLVHCQKTMAFDTEEKVLKDEVIIPGVKDCLNDPSIGAYYVAERDGKLVGTTMVTYEQSVEVGGQIDWI